MVVTSNRVDKTSGSSMCWSSITQKVWFASLWVRRKHCLVVSLTYNKSKGGFDSAAILMVLCRISLCVNHFSCKIDMLLSDHFQTLHVHRSRSDSNTINIGL